MTFPWGVDIICGYCGHRADMGDFCSTVTGELPPGEFQCPHCRRAWRIERVGKPVVTPSGYVIPPDNRLVEIQGRL